MSDQIPEPLKSVVIVGGGTAGWIAAGVLRSYLNESQLDIHLIESPDIPTIGVGEATVPPLVDLVRKLGINEADMMARCNATWKLGIRFDDWHPGGHSYWHPFGYNAAIIDGLPLFYFWLRHRLSGGQDEFTDYSPNWELASSNLGLTTNEGLSPVVQQGSYAYHLDAALFADYLKNICVNRGVKHVLDQVVEVTTSDTGINALLCKQTGSYVADFYIDASGFQSLLSNGGLDNGWIDWSEDLLCNRALVTPIKSAKQLSPFTLASAQSAGWIWQVPLSHRTGCGYVFSNNHIDDDQALEDLKKFVGNKNLTGEPRFIDMPVGRREKFWKKNCVSIGLSAGFVEPLESTGIFLIQEGMKALLRYFPDQSMNPALARRYNGHMTGIYEDIRDFIVLHYHLAGRAEPFWQDARNTRQSSDLQALLEFYDATGLVEKTFAELFPSMSAQTILTGNGRLPVQPPAQACRLTEQRLIEILSEIRRRNRELATSHHEHSIALAEFTKPADVTRH